MTDSSYLIFILAGLVLAGLIGVLAFLRRMRVPKSLPVDEMEGHDFEYYCADLLRKCGYQDVEVTKGSGDFGVDILARKEGITYAVQCKCYDSLIGVFAVQQVYAGRDYYGCMVGAVMTNQYFTDPARKLAAGLGVLLWDRDHLEYLEGIADG